MKEDPDSNLPPTKHYIKKCEKKSLPLPSQTFFFLLPALCKCLSVPLTVYSAVCIFKEFKKSPTCFYSCACITPTTYITRGCFHKCTPLPTSILSHAQYGKNNFSRQKLTRRFLNCE